MHKAFFGDRERDFSLTPLLIPELQRLTGKAIGATIDSMRRLSHAEIVETIRLALIGGGTNPQDAANLVATYVPARPLIEANFLAIAILTDLWVGPKEQPLNEAAATGDLSAAINGGAA